MTENQSAFKHPFQVCSAPMRRYLEQMFAYGEYHDVVLIAQAELRENPYNLDMILYQAIGVLEMQAREIIPPAPDMVSRAVNQLGILTDLVSLVEVPLESGLGYYLALGNLLLGNVDTADQLMEVYAMHHGENPQWQEQYAAFRSQWGERAQTMPRKWRAPKYYVS